MRIGKKKSTREEIGARNIDGVGVETYGNDIPVFSITFGDADPDQLEELAEMTGARVFDGTEDLTEAFRGVKGYN